MSKIELSTTSNTNFLKMPRSQKKGEEKWKDIEDLINRWARRSPKDAYELEKYIKSVKSGLLDKKHGLMGGKADADNAPATRIGIAIHPDLLQYIQAFYPDFMDSKTDLHEFKKRFKKFTIPEA